MSETFFSRMIGRLPWFDSLITTDRVNKLVEQGRLFGCAAQVTIANGASGYILIRTPAGINPHIKLEFIAGGPGSVEGRGAPTISAVGTQATRNNFFIGHANQPQMLVYTNPTVSNEGVVLVRYLLQSGSNNTVVGTGEQPTKFILPPSQDFLLKFTNAGSGTNEYGIQMNWIEVPLGTVKYS